MGRPKKIKEALTAAASVSASSAIETNETEEVLIQPLTLDLNREDLNTLVSKVNEIITHINK